MAGGTVGAATPKPVVNVEQPKPGTPPSRTAVTMQEAIVEGYEGYVRHAADKWRQTDVNEFGFKPEIPVLYPSNLEVKPKQLKDGDIPQTGRIGYIDFANFGDEWTRTPKSYEALVGTPCEPIGYTNYGMAMGGTFCETFGVSGYTRTGAPEKLAGQKVTRDVDGRSVDFFVDSNKINHMVRWQEQRGTDNGQPVFSIYEIKADRSLYPDTQKLVDLAVQSIHEGPKPGLSDGAMDKKLPYTDADFRRITIEHLK